MTLSLVEFETSIRKGLSYLSKQHVIAYLESWHIYSNPEVGTYVGDIFPRAVIIDTLIDLKLAGYRVKKNVIDEDTKFLIWSATEGGWRYFPKWADVPPDADTLGQILQVLSRLQYGALRVCENGITLLMKNSFSDGSFNTWLVNDTRLLESANKVFGGGRDVEVVANILYGLYLYDKARFKKHILKGLSFLLSKQELDGSWTSTWYLRKYYGTYVCLRMLSEVINDSASYKKSLNFLLSNQMSDGSWHRETTSTAFALLALSYVSRLSKATAASSLKKATDFLLSMQLKDGSWPTGPYVKMVNPEDPSAFIEYSSRTVTTAFCLKALLRSTNFI